MKTLILMGLLCLIGIQAAYSTAERGKQIVPFPPPAKVQTHKSGNKKQGLVDTWMEKRLSKRLEKQQKRKKRAEFDFMGFIALLIEGMGILFYSQTGTIAVLFGAGIAGILIGLISLIRIKNRRNMGIKNYTFFLSIMAVALPVILGIGWLVIYGLTCALLSPLGAC